MNRSDGRRDDRLNFIIEKPIFRIQKNDSASERTTRRVIVHSRSRDSSTVDHNSRIYKAYFTEVPFAM